MLQVLSPAAAAAPRSSSFEERSRSSSPPSIISTSTNAAASATATATATATAAATEDCGPFGSRRSQGAAAAAAVAAGLTTSEYCDQLEIANYFLEMAANRSFSLQDEERGTTTTAGNGGGGVDFSIPPTIATTLMTTTTTATTEMATTTTTMESTGSSDGSSSSDDSLVPRIRGGRIPTTTTIATVDSEITPPVTSLPATPGLPPPPSPAMLPLSQAPPAKGEQQQQQQQSPPPPPFSPPPPTDVDLYEKRPLPALPAGGVATAATTGGKRHSGSSTLSREIKAAFATPPHESGSFFESEEGDAPPQPHPQSQPQSQTQTQQLEQEQGGIPAPTDDDRDIEVDMDDDDDDDDDWEETEIRVVLDRPGEIGGSTKAQQRLVGESTDMRFRVDSSPSPSPSFSRQSGILFSPQPKLAPMQKLLRLTGAGKSSSSHPAHINTTSHPASASILGGGGGGGSSSGGASSTPSGHNSMHKIKQLMGVDVAPRESSSSEFVRRARWSHQDDDVFASDQDIEISEGCFLDSDDDSEMGDHHHIPLAPTSAPMTTGFERRNRFEDDDDDDDVSREEGSPFPAPLFINKNHRDLLYDDDDALVRPSSSAGERRLGLSSSHQNQYSSTSSLHYKEDLYHRTTVQLSKSHHATTNNNNNNNNSWRNSGSSITGVSPPATRESHGSSSFGSNSQLIKTPTVDTAEKPPPPSSSSSSGNNNNKIPDTPTTWSSSPGLPSGRSPLTGTSPAAADPVIITSITSQPQPQPQQRKRATSTGGAFGKNIVGVGQRFQNWQSQHRQPSSSSTESTSTRQVNKQQTPKVKIPTYDPATDPHPGIRIILPYELEEEEFPVSSPTTTTPKSSNRASIVSNLLKRISGSTITPTSPASHHSISISHHGLGHKKRPSEPTTPTWLTASGVTGQGIVTPITPASSPIGQVPPQSSTLLLLDTLSLSPIPPKIVSPTSAAAATIPISTPENNPEQEEEPLLSPPHSPRVAQPLQSAIITKTTGFSVLTEQQAVPDKKEKEKDKAEAEEEEEEDKRPPANNRSSFSISEPPSPILSSLASLGHLNLSSGTLGLGSHSKTDREREREDRGEQNPGKRSVSSLGFRASSSKPTPLQLQLNLGPGLRAVADRSTMIAQRTNELVGQVGKSLGKSVVSKTKRLGNLNLRSSVSGSGSGSLGFREAGGGDREKEKEKEKEKDRERVRMSEDKDKDKEGRWREDIKSRIRVLDDGGRVLGGGAADTGNLGGAGNGNGNGNGGSTTTTNLLIPLGSPAFQSVSGAGTGRLPPPVRPERSPILPGSDFGLGVGHNGEDEEQGNQESAVVGKEGVLVAAGRGSGSTDTDSIEAQAQAEIEKAGTGSSGPLMTGLRSPPVVPARSKARPSSGSGSGTNIPIPGTPGISALSSIGFGSNGGGSRPGSRQGGSRPGSSRGILREAFTASPGIGGSAPPSVLGGSSSRPGSSRGVVTVSVSPRGEGLGGSSRDGRPGTPREGAGTGTDEVETWV